MGCCDDGACTPETCMILPDGKHCSDCHHVLRCTAIFGAKETDSHCQFFPRRFHERKPISAETIGWALEVLGEATRNGH